MISTYPVPSAQNESKQDERTPAAGSDCRYQPAIQITTYQEAILSGKNMFRSRGYLSDREPRSESGSALDFSKIPAFLRVLLTTDGTVTKSLESFFWEPVNVEKLIQQEVVLEQSDPLLNLTVGTTVLKRQIQLRGGNSNKVYAKATSIICTELLPPDVLSNVKLGGMGIGELLRECGLETYREIIDYGECFFNADDHPKRNAIWRTYLIRMEHKPFIQVTETFPLDIYL